MATKTKAAKPAEVKPAAANKPPKAAEKPQHEIDVENLKKEVEFLKNKSKSQSEQIHLMSTYCNSCENIIIEIRKNLKRVAEVSGVNF